MSPRSARAIPPPQPHETLLPAYIRAAGAVTLGFAAGRSGTRLVERADGGGYLVRTPRPHAGSCEAVLINTGGGMAGGDRLALTATTGPDADAVITTQAAEKIYRSQGPATEIEVGLTLGSRSRLAWLPQETILFSGSRLNRRLAAELPGDATLTIAEMLVFGRTAMQETVETGDLRDRWRIRRDGRLIFADEVRLAAAPARLLERKASGNGARALATILHIAPEAEARLDGMRALPVSGLVESGASAWDGMLLMRFVAQDAQALRHDLVAAIEWLRGAPVPRSW